MRIIFFGSGEFGLPTLQWLMSSGHEIALVVSQPPRGSGRGRLVTPTPISAAAAEAGLALIETEDVNQPEMVAKLAVLKADLGVVIAFGQKIKEPARKAHKLECVNLHASLLPKYRGAAPIHWAIVRGETETGVTVFRLVDRMDAGAMLSQMSVEILPDETTGELHDRLAIVGVQAMQTAIVLHEQGEIPTGTVQDESHATLAPKLKKSDGFVDFGQSAATVDCRIRGMTPWPGAMATFLSESKREDLLLLKTRIHAPLPGVTSIEPGTLDERLMVATGDGGQIELLEVKPASGKAMGWADYVRGRAIKRGDRLVTPSLE